MRDNIKIIVECVYGNVGRGTPTEKALEFGCDACEYIEGREVHRCSKFVGLVGKNPQEDGEMKETWKCLDSWMPVLMIESSQQMRGVQDAVVSSREDTRRTMDNLSDNLKNNIIVGDNVNKMVGLSKGLNKGLNNNINRGINNNMLSNKLGRDEIGRLE